MGKTAHLSQDVATTIARAIRVNRGSGPGTGPRATPRLGEGAMYDDDTHEVPLAQRGAPTYAPTVVPPVHRRREPSPRLRSAVVVGSSSVLAALVAVILALGAFTVLDRDTAVIPTDVARPAAREPVPAVPTGTGDPVGAPVELVADEPVVPFRAQVRLRTTGGLVAVRLSSPTVGRVRWLLVGPLGRVVDRRRLTIGPRAREIRVRGLAAGRFTWRVTPMASGPVRSGVIAVAGVPVVPPPPSAPPPASSPSASSSSPGDSPSSGAPPVRPPHRPPGRGRATTAAQPQHPHQQHEVDPDDVPDPVDPSPRTTTSRG